MAKKWEIKVIARSSPTAEAQLKNAEGAGFELYEANGKCYKLRRPWERAAEAADVEEHPEPEEPEETEPSDETE